MYVIRHTHMAEKDRDICPVCLGELYTIEGGKYVFCMSEPYDRTTEDWWKECTFHMSIEAWNERCELEEFLRIKSEDEHKTLEQFK